MLGVVLFIVNCDSKKPLPLLQSPTVLDKNNCHALAKTAYDQWEENHYTVVDKAENALWIEFKLSSENEPEKTINCYFKEKKNNL